MLTTGTYGQNVPPVNNSLPFYTVSTTQIHIFSQRQSITVNHYVIIMAIMHILVNKKSNYCSQLKTSQPQTVGHGRVRIIRIFSAQSTHP